jgi:hypothetical protein
MRLDKEVIDGIAEESGYHLIDHQPNIGLVSYSDGPTRINVYMTKMTVATCLNHPTKGKTQLFRRNVSEHMLKEIFQQPRKHTGKGYYKKG